MRIDCGQHEKPRISTEDKLIVAFGIVILIISSIEIYLW